MFTKKDLEKLATLARIELSPDELNKYSKELASILEYIEKLKELDVTLTEPTTHVMHLANVFRKDEIKPSIDIEEVLKHAPQRKGTFFKVPKIID
ncbi:MAG: Asp-tRNA(Asn)/Glu-tRNA(Gln) amidotransferase subunit GatC [Candidatus Omnitrophota bacterium]